MKVREVIRVIEGHGWRIARQRGSHRQYVHPNKRGTVTVAGRLNVDVPPGTLHSIMKQAGLR
jgi:predicted RNA binding protein YcfA (HicA-like mRNA interferase family)